MTKGTEHPLNTWYWCAQSGNACGLYTYVVGNPGDPDISGNVNVTADDWCFGQIKGDPDIAGWGVFGGLLTNAFVTVLISLTFVWFPWFKRKSNRLPNMMQTASGSVVENESSAATEPPDDKATSSAELLPLENLLLVLGDTNLVSSLAIMISSMIKMYSSPNYPLYHVFVARALAGLAITGHIAASQVYKNLREHHKWSLYLRISLSTISIALYVVWSIYALQRFVNWERTWNDAAAHFTPTCFSTYRSVVPGDFTLWIRINLVAMPLGFIWLLLNPSTWAKNADNVIDTVDEAILEWLYQVCYKLRTTFTASNEPMWKYFLFTTRNIVLALLETLVMLATLAFIAFFLPTTILNPITSLVYGVGWDSYDLITVKLSNSHAVVSNLETRSPLTKKDNPEDEMGFGQIFPLVMILLLLLAGLDAYAETISRRGRSKSIPSTTRNQIASGLSQRPQPINVSGGDTAGHTSGLVQRRTTLQHPTPAHAH